MSDVTDLEKIKIDLLRDALKDVTDTIRALDRKVVFLVSYNALFLGAIVAIFAKNWNMILTQAQGLSTSLFGLFIFLWILFLIGIMLNIRPKYNPLDALYDREKMFGENLFFISTLNDKKYSLEFLTNCYDERVDSIKNVKKLLYSEIIILSYIRDSRIKEVKVAAYLSYLFTFVFAIVFLGYILRS